MAITIPAAYIETFESTVRQLAQQNQSKLRMCVSEVNKQSKTHNWDRLAASAARLKPGPRAKSPQGGDKDFEYYDTAGYDEGLAWTRRNTLVAAYDTGEIIEQEDIVQMLIDPKSATTENLVMNMRRQVDDIIIAAATGAAGDGAGGTVAFPAGQEIGDYSTEIDMDTVLAVRKVFQVNDVDPEEAKYFVIGPNQEHSLLRLIEVTSSDFQHKQALADGYLPNFLGFNWIISNRLTVPDTDQLDCLAFTRRALGLHVAGDIKAEVGQRTDMSFAWQVYLSLQMAAVRVEDEHIVRFKAADTVT